jgi:peptidyl-tRNA hydrolase
MTVKLPHQTPEEIIQNAQQEDPFVMYYVARAGRAFDLGQAMILAGAASVACADTYRSTDKWQERFLLWYQESYRKVVLRASEDQFDEIKQLDSVCFLNHQGEALLCLPPRRKSEREEILSDLKPFTDAKKAKIPSEIKENAISYIIREEVMKSAGKAMAQAGHASLMCADYFSDEYKEAFSKWREMKCPGNVYLADDWEGLKNQVDCTYVTDAGLTQLDPGTETVLVIPPTALPSDIAASLVLVP